MNSGCDSTRRKFWLYVCIRYLKTRFWIYIKDFIVIFRSFKRGLLRSMSICKQTRQVNYLWFWFNIYILRDEKRSNSESTVLLWETNELFNTDKINSFKYFNLINFVALLLNFHLQGSITLLAWSTAFLGLMLWLKITSCKGNNYKFRIPLCFWFYDDSIVHLIFLDDLLEISLSLLSNKLKLFFKFQVFFSSCDILVVHFFAEWLVLRIRQRRF